MRIKYQISSLLVSILLLGSCSTPKNITYFQDVAQGTVIDPVKQLDIKVKPEDKLSIIVTTQDPALSNLFNLVQVQTRLEIRQHQRSERRTQMTVEHLFIQ